jgi:hypothetical protein
MIFDRLASNRLVVEGRVLEQQARIARKMALSRARIVENPQKRAKMAT